MSALRADAAMAGGEIQGFDGINRHQPNDGARPSLSAAIQKGEDVVGISAVLFFVWIGATGSHAVGLL
jgi:hypothetical protein